MSTLPPRPVRKSAAQPVTTFDDDDYGTADFLADDAPRVVFGSGNAKRPAEPVEDVQPAVVRPSRPSYTKPTTEYRDAPVAAPVTVREAPVTVKAPTPSPAPVVETPVPQESMEIRPVTAEQSTTSAGQVVAVGIDNAIQKAPVLIDNAIQQTPVLIGNIVDHYSEQGKKDRLIANVLNGTALVSLVTGVFGPMVLAFPLVLSIIGLGWGKKARRNGMSTTLSSIMGWTVIGVSVSGIVIFAALAGTAYLFFGKG
jgi:hypothetical protein